MANRVVLLVGAALDGLDGTTNGDVLTWDSSTSSWSAQPAGSGSSPYDLSGETADTVSISDVIFHFIAVRNFTMSALSQSSNSTTVVKLQVNGSDASYPQSVTAGQTVTAVVTTGGVGVWFTATGTA
jgi:hypothetical protein